MFKQYFKNHEAAQLFSEPIIYVTNFIEAHNRLPSREVFLKQKFSSNKEIDITFDYSTSPYKSKSKNDYILSFWRGEWHDYYYSVNKINTCEEFSFITALVLFILPSIGVFTSIQYVHHSEIS
jgi:hypothetical protein